ALEALPGLPGAPRRDGQLRRLRADGRGDEGIVVGARRPESPAPRIRRLGSAHRLVLKQVDKCFRWALYDREPLPTWSKGRLTLLGDAAHPMLPHLGQGANQSIEDGMALATILSQVDNAKVPAARLAYEKLRRARVAEVQRGSRQHGLRVASMVADLAVGDAELAAHANFRAHLYSFDVVPHARAAVAALG